MITLSIRLKNRQMSGKDEFTATAGQNVKVETTPNGVEILDEVVPAGHQWACRVWIEIVETEV